MEEMLDHGRGLQNQQYLLIREQILHHGLVAISVYVTGSTKCVMSQYSMIWS